MRRGRGGSGQRERKAAPVEAGEDRTHDEDDTGESNENHRQRARRETSPVDERAREDNERRISVEHDGGHGDGDESH